MLGYLIVFITFSDVLSGKFYTPIARAKEIMYFNF